MLKYVWIPLIIAAYLWLLPPLIPAQSPPVPITVTITATQSIAPENSVIAARAAAFTAQFFRDHYNAELKEPIEVILASDTMNYIHTLEPLVGHNFAIYQATHSAGTTVNNSIIINTGASQSYEDTLFLTSHELAHQYQLQTMTTDITRFNWLVEGMADVIAANVVAANFTYGSGKINNYRQSWTRMLALTDHHLHLSDLDHRPAWQQAVSVQGSIAYRTAALAVFVLIDRTGYQSLQTFFTDKSADREQAFQKAFGIPLDDFATEFEKSIVNN